MVSLQEVEQRLTSAGLRGRYRGRPEVRELCRILHPDEIIAKAVHGNYENGSALLIATDRRLLLIDKKPFFLNLQDVGYHIIADVHFEAKFTKATMLVRSSTKHLRFSARRVSHLRELTSLVQQRIMEIRHFSGAPAGSPMSLAFDPTRQTYVLAPENVQAQPSSRLTSRQISRPNTSFRRRVSRFYPSSS